MDISACIFDLDGVLCFTDKYHYLAWKRLADGLGIRFDREMNNRLRGVTHMASLEIILENYRGQPLTDAEKTELAERKNTMYRESLAQMTAAGLAPGDQAYSGQAERARL